MAVVVEPGAGGELAWWCHPTIESGFRVVDRRWATARWTRLDGAEPEGGGGQTGSQMRGGQSRRTGWRAWRRGGRRGKGPPHSR
jgi:hypothetical protein